MRLHFTSAEFFVSAYPMQTQPQCPVSFTTRVIGGKWKARLVWALLREQPRRFSELRRACPPISDRILSKELKELEAWGLIARREFPTIPPRTEYRLTERGETLRPLMAAMAAWGSSAQESLTPPEAADGLDPSSANPV